MYGARRDKIMPAAAAAVTCHEPPFGHAAGNDDGNVAFGAALHGFSDTRIGVAGTKRRKNDTFRSRLQACINMGGITAGMNGDDIDALIGYPGGKPQRCGSSQRPGRAEGVRLVRAQLVKPQAGRQRPPKERSTPFPAFA